MSEKISPKPNLIQEEQDLTNFQWPFHLLQDRVRRSKRNLILTLAIAGFILAMGTIIGLILAAGILDSIFS